MIKTFILMSALVAFSPCLAYSANLQGSIRFDGEVKENPPLPMKSDSFCRQSHKEPVYLKPIDADKKGYLKNVFIYIQEGLQPIEAPKSYKKETLTQQGCVQSPRVMGLLKGQELEAVNKDATFHNLRAITKNSAPFNEALHVEGMKIKKVFADPEIMITLKCDVHPWEKTFVGVTEHPYFSVSDSAGHYEISNLPPGKYEVGFWHEVFGLKKIAVEIGSETTETLDLVFKKDGDHNWGISPKGN